MTTQEIYRLAVQLGLKYDPRGEGETKHSLNLVRKKYAEMKPEERAEFDQDRLFNPYTDTRVLVDCDKGEIKKVLAGIDMEGSELLLADRLGDIDLVIAHHPEGKALNNLGITMTMQAKINSNYGVPISLAEKSIRSRIGEVNRAVAVLNNQRFVDFAKILKLDYLCTHSSADNLAGAYVKSFLHSRQPETLQDLIAGLKTIPEYKKATIDGNAPNIISGDPEDSCGKIAVDFTGGTSPSKEIYEALARAGIDTLITMHMKEPVLKEIQNTNLNVVIASHMASDSLGMNLFLDELEKQGIEVIPVSGLIRVKRFQS